MTQCIQGWGGSKLHTYLHTNIFFYFQWTIFPCLLCVCCLLNLKKGAREDLMLACAWGVWSSVEFWHRFKPVKLLFISKRILLSGDTIRYTIRLKTRNMYKNLAIACLVCHIFSAFNTCWPFLRLQYFLIFYVSSPSCFLEFFFKSQWECLKR